MYRCNNKECGKSFETHHNCVCPACKIGKVLPQSFLNQQERKKSKKDSTEKYLAAAKQEIRRLEKGINKVIELIGTEDIREPEVVYGICEKLIELYNGKEIE